MKPVNESIMADMSHGGDIAIRTACFVVRAKVADGVADDGDVMDKAREVILGAIRDHEAEAKPFYASKGERAAISVIENGGELAPYHAQNALFGAILFGYEVSEPMWRAAVDFYRNGPQ